MENIQNNDVLFGRGGASNNHIGNKEFRAIVAEHQPDYLAAKKKDKSAISRLIVGIIREKGGRFLRKDDATNIWVDVGDKKAAEKTSQALRENLDIRHKEFRQHKKAPRRHSASSSASSSDEQHHTNKKRRLVVEGKVATSSPVLVSEEPGVLPVPLDLRTGQELGAAPTLCYQPPPVNASDCDDVAAV